MTTVPTLRVIAASSILCFLLLLPLLNLYGDWGIGHFYGVGILAMGADYLSIFFHEIGHTLAAWSFGIPAFPSFDFQHGGGMTYSYEPSRLLAGFIYLLAILGCLWLWRSYYIAIAIGCGIFIVLHIIIHLTGGAQAAVTFMGHGFETLVGAALIFLSLLNITTRGSIDRYLNMTFGLYIFFSQILDFRILHSPEGRIAYSEQKGGHVQGDLEVLARTWNVEIASVANIYILYNVFIYAVMIGLYFWVRKDFSRQGA